MKKIITIGAACVLLLFPGAAAAKSKAKACTKKTAIEFVGDQPYHFCYHKDAVLVAITPGSALMQQATSDGPQSVFEISYYNSGQIADEFVKNQPGYVKKKSMKNKNGVSGFYFEQKDIDPAAPVHKGIFLINKKSKGKEFVQIRFDDQLPTPKHLPTLLKTFSFR